jgi:hypothetical protein
VLEVAQRATVRVGGDKVMKGSMVQATGNGRTERRGSGVWHAHISAHCAKEADALGHFESNGY